MYKVIKIQNYCKNKKIQRFLIAVKINILHPEHKTIFISPYFQPVHILRCAVQEEIIGALKKAVRQTFCGDLRSVLVSVGWAFLPVTIVLGSGWPAAGSTGIWRGP